MKIEYGYIFSAILGAISILGVIFCIVRGKGVWHKILVLFSSMLGVVVMVCFGGEVVLNHFDMGWRCAPVNIMLILGGIFLIVTLCCSMRELIVLKGANSILVRCGVASMLLVIFIILIFALGYFTLSSWWDGLTTYNGQTIVYATDQHGGSAAWRYYTHINNLVHGVEILQEGSWIGNPPHFLNP